MLFLGTFSRADNYYCLIFSYDSKPIPLPYKCHVWGVFVHTNDKGQIVEEFPVSWEPDKISFIDRKRSGWHSTLQDNLERASKYSIRMWGPFETERDFFLKAKAQHLAEGKYKFFDFYTRKKAQNCIHRLSDIAGPHRTGIYWGWWAADSVYKHYRRKNVIRDTDNTTVVQLLGLDKHPQIVRMR